MIDYYSVSLIYLVVNNRGRGALRERGEGLNNFLPLKMGSRVCVGRGEGLKEDLRFLEDFFWEGEGGKHIQYFYISAFNRDIVFQGNIKIALREKP